METPETIKKPRAPRTPRAELLSVDAATKTEEAPSAKVLNERLSAELGDTVYSRDAQWLRFSQEGVVVKLHLERKRFKLQLTLQDLGIEPEDEAEERKLNSILAPGHKYLLPVAILKKADAIDSLARENLKRYGLRTFWGYFVHVKNYAAWRSRNDEIRALYYGLVDQIEADYDDLKRQALEAWVSVCIRAYENLRVNPASGRIPGFEDREGWIRAQVERMERAIPDMAVIRPSFAYEYEATSLPSLKQIEQDRIDAGRLRLSEAERLMLEDIEATAKAQVAGGVDQFMTEVRSQVQTALFDVMTQSLSVLQGNQGKGLGRNTSVAIQKVIKATQDKAFWGEGNLDDRLRQLQAMLDTPARKRDYREVEALLRTVAAESRAVLLELDAAPVRSGLDVGVPDDFDGLTEVITRGGYLGGPEDDAVDLGTVRARVGAADLDFGDDDLTDGLVR